MKEQVVTAMTETGEVRGRTAGMVALELWNIGKDVACIAEHLKHRYDNALARLVQDYIRTYQGAEELPGFPVMRKADAEYRTEYPAGR